MDNDFIDIEEFAKIVNKSTSTIRRNIKNLSEKEKIWFVRRVPVVGSGGEKILLAKAWSNNFARHKQANEQPFIEGGNDANIIEILRGQLDIKDTQISSLSEANKELLERLKEVNYTVANLQKQISAPVSEQTKTFEMVAIFGNKQYYHVIKYLIVRKGKRKPVDMACTSNITH